ncbi:hypothetical protein Fmac_025198 [Flemingia macrophylla]|uniref:EF-hand domain-containing protein n=1 Tax=Flemingia macrophylla TaxID=520843 RepID=A0ABD1LRK0_9FABA
MDLRLSQGCSALTQDANSVQLQLLFEEVLKAMNMSPLIPLAPRIFDLFDNNCDGTVDMQEILCGFSSFENSRGDDALPLCFQVSLLP